MKSQLECIPCFIKQSLEAARLVTDKISVQEKVLKEVMKHLTTVKFEKSPPELSREVHRIIKKVTKSNDPYKTAKDKSNKIAKKQYPYLKKIIKNSDDHLLMAIKLAIVGISLSIFSAYGFLEMDEVMLSAILFLLSVGLSKINWRIIPGIIFIIFFSYFALIHYNLESIFIGHYLGGYPAAFYYFPIMLIGLYIGKGIISDGLWCTRNQIIISMIFIYFIFFSIFIPFNKMTVTPPFILLSILFSFAIFSMIDFISNSNIFFKRLEYIGKTPLRYWLMMYLFFLVPLLFYIEFFNISSPLDIQWYFSILISLILIIILWRLSYLIDYVNISK